MRPSMSDDRLWRARAVTHLRDMLRRVILEEYDARERDLEKAGHLADAVKDLRTLITRLEAASSTATFSDREPFHSTSASSATPIVEPPTHHP